MALCCLCKGDFKLKKYAQGVLAGARLLLQPGAFQFLAIAHCMRPFAGIAGVGHVDMKLS
jgi:hypothetical protein